MRPAEEFMPQQLVGKRVAFKNEEDHADCWHAQVGLQGGVVLRPGQSLAQKAEMLAAEAAVPENWFSDYEEVVRLWIKVDPCESFPRGCEAAVDQECLLVLDPSDEN